ncbi:cation diffusion facilitator family transporter [Serratia marcescens]|uniref:Cation transporter n=1 Tax=Serratia marcescens TaxID=615 RepID=A0AAP8TQL9_SERMA|nr:cation diffusion facilitator family transporter [Serratia marcescens]PNO70415.1 cation transporter [Serratia marcescens]
MQNEKQAVARNSMIASGLLATGKFVAGIFTGSIGLISEGIHSFTDFIATSITWLAVRISDKPADDDHHFGHGKVENLAALFEVLLLLGAAGWIVYEAGSSLLGQPHEIVAAPVVIAVLLISICVDFFRVRALNRVAKATDSAALEADALHFFSDMLSSGVVLLGMVFVLLGFGRADAIAALIVAGFIFVAAIKLGKRSFDSLMDAAPAGATEAIRATLASFPAVLACDSVRIRNAGAVLFVEITVAVCRTLPLERIDALKREIVERLREQYASAEFTVIAVPQTRSDEDMATRIRAIAANHGAQVQNVTLQQLPTRMAIGMDLAVPANASVAQAHDIATEIEGILRQAIGEDTEIETHLEPQTPHWLTSEDVDATELADIRRILQSALEQGESVQDVHNVRARKTDGGIIVNFHCRVSPAVTIAAAHDAVDRVERRLLSLYPAITRAIGHVEPIKPGI